MALVLQLPCIIERFHGRFIIHMCACIQVTASYEQLKVTKKEQESELSELRQNKELLTQWEQQIADIIQWVTEEKDARSYLKSMAKKLADDVEGLKSTANTLNRVYVYVIML